MNLSSPADATEPTPRARRVNIPRLRSLDHRLQHAKDANGRPIPLRDELLFLLDDPPAGTGDRWQKGADLCAQHGIETSRVSVWRFYRTHILPWRRMQIPPAPAAPPDPLATAQLQEQARQLAAQRAVEMLNDPCLSPGHLVCLLQNDNHRQQIQLARDQFDHQVATKRRAEQRERFRQIDEQTRDQQLGAARAQFQRQILAAAIPPGFTP